MCKHCLSSVECRYVADSTGVRSGQRAAWSTWMYSSCLLHLDRSIYCTNLPGARERSSILDRGRTPFVFAFSAEESG